jgi:hypothetical protein
MNMERCYFWMFCSRHNKWQGPVFIHMTNTFLKKSGHSLFNSNLVIRPDVIILTGQRILNDDKFGPH